VFNPLPPPPLKKQHREEEKVPDVNSSSSSSEDESGEDGSESEEEEEEDGTAKKKAQRVKKMIDKRNTSVAAQVMKQKKKKKRATKKNEDEDVSKSAVLVIENYTLPGDVRAEVMSRVNMILNRFPKKGAKFKLTYDTEIRSDPVVFKTLRVNANRNTRPKCILCINAETMEQRKIERQEHRVRYAVVNSERAKAAGLSNQRIETCEVHNLCLPCYATLLAHKREGFEDRCFAKCMRKKGGCRKIKSQRKKVDPNEDFDMLTGEPNE
jgi:hypothetical protein